MTATKLGSRAKIVLLQSDERYRPYACEACGGSFTWKFRHGKPQTKAVLCNVYSGGRWERLARFHPECYRGQYGEPAE